MTSREAHTAVSLSALIVGGTYLFRKLTEPPSTPAPGQLPNAQQLLTQLAVMGGESTVPPVGQFVVAWGFVFIILSILAEAAPDLAGLSAGTVAAGSLLGNGTKVFQDVQDALNRPPSNVGPNPQPTVTANYLGSAGSPGIGSSDIPFLSPTPPGTSTTRAQAGQLAGRPGNVRAGQ